MKTLPRFFALTCLTLLPLASAGCATMNWEALLDGVTAAIDDVLDEAAASSGTTSLQESANRALERRAAEGRAAQDQVFRQLSEDRQALREEGDVVCSFRDYNDFFVHVLEKYKDVLSFRGDGGHGVMDVLLGGMAEALERDFSETLKDCSSMTERFIRGDIPLLDDEDRFGRIVGFAMVRTDDWQEMERDYFPVVRRWAADIYLR